MAERVMSNRSEDLNTLGRKFKFPEVPFPRITYDEAREISIKGGISFEWGEDLPTEGGEIRLKAIRCSIFHNRLSSFSTIILPSYRGE